MREYLLDSRIELPAVIRAAVQLAKVAPSTAVSQIKKNTETMARTFIAGENIEQAIKIFSSFEGRREATFDIVGETTISDEGAQNYADSYFAGLGFLEDKYGINAVDRFGMPKINMSTKLSAVEAHFDPLDPKGTSRRVRDKLRPTLSRAKEIGAFINFDMEHYQFRNLINKIFYDFLQEDEFKHYPHFGRVVQAYLVDSPADLKETMDFANKRGVPVTTRLVKGAYWDHEVMLALQNGWKIPVFTKKNKTDANYEQLAQIILKEKNTINGAFGTHNARSIAAVLALAEKYHLNDDDYEFQKLFGNCEELGSSLEKRNKRMRDYVPSGVMILAMGYFVRRLLENSSNKAFVRGLRKDADIGELLRNPMNSADEKQIRALVKSDGWKLPGWLSWIRALSFSNGNNADKSNGQKTDASSYELGQLDSLEFRNYPAPNFSDERERDAMETALQKLQAKAGKIRYDIQVGSPIKNRDSVNAGDLSADTGRYLNSLNPSTGELLGKVSLGGKDHINAALSHAYAAKNEWAQTPARERADYLLKAADTMAKKEYELSALVTLEAAKNRVEARGDIGEAIDFSRYYAKRMLQLAQFDGKSGENGKYGERITQRVAGEQNLIRYAPYGVASIISPWNFPIAILNGMLAAAIVTGNTAVAKPSPETPLCAAELMQVYENIGLPANVLQLVICEDSDASLFVDSPLVDLIAFTGSENIGKKIYQDAAIIHKGQNHFKKVILETGGKNAIIIDSSADLEQAVAGCIKSAFSYSGEKCSAGSRFIVLDEVYHAFVTKLVAATKSLRVGNAADITTDVTALINQKAYNKVIEYISKAQEDGGRILLQGKLKTNKGLRGFYIHPTLIEIDEHNFLAQEEAFGPVAGIIRAKSFDHTVDIANGTRFALTAGLYSRTPSHIQKAEYLLRAGNIYINRPIVGAIVQRQPFGGFAMSGAGTKTGGEDYLFNFMHQIVVSTNLARSGYIPKIEESLG